MSANRESALDFRNTNTLWCGVLVETLARLGLRQAVVSPGSRSAPLTFALARHPGVEAIPVLDERSAGFFALGLAKRRRRPVALVCTSGTAAANFLPAVVEAHESGVPLLVLTADRPPELRDCHSGQTVDQVKLYGGYVHFQHELAVPEGTLPRLRYLRQIVAHAFERSLAPACGPVHLNCPFRDPLVPLADNVVLPPTGQFTGFFDGLTETAPVRVAAVAPRRWTRRGVIIVGPTEPEDGAGFARAIGRISRALGWPVLADALSPVRMQAAEAGSVVTRYDTLLRNERLAAELAPEQVICIGGWPTSKVLRGWLQTADPAVTLVTERIANEDGLHLRTRVARGGVEAWSRGFSGRKTPSPYARRWLAAEARAARALAAALRRERVPIEPQWPGILAAGLPRGTACFVASSMPVRDAEYFWPAGNRAQRLHFNRGANGIDGTLSTALGIAHGDGRPAVLVTGDLAFLHDSNGLLSVPKLRGSLTIVLINNRGGGIFEHLPVARFEPPFETYFATPQRVDFGPLCRAYGVAHTRVKSASQLGRLVAHPPARGVRVLELRTDRRRDAAWRKELFARVAAKLG